MSKDEVTQSPAVPDPATPAVETDPKAPVSPPAPTEDDVVRPADEGDDPPIKK